MTKEERGLVMVSFAVVGRWDQKKDQTMAKNLVGTG